MKLIVGLGNPGKEYANTRHNVGFQIVDSYVKDSSWIKEKNYLKCSLIHNSEKVLIIKPTTFMNLSGLAVRSIVDFYKINPTDILVIHDDLDLPSGVYRLKSKSSSGGHNGIKSIIECINTDNFARLKIGIGRSDRINTKNYVLSKLSSEELDYLNNEKFHQIINSFIDRGIEKTMNDYNNQEEK